MSRLPRPQLVDIQTIVGEIFEDNLHKKRQLSLANAALGLLMSESLFIHEMGEGLALAKGNQKKHCTKQIDRLLSNASLSIWDLSQQWVPYIVGEQKNLMVALDWTCFADDEQWTLCLNILTSKGCSTPLLWQTVHYSQLKHNRARYEDQLLSRLKEVLPEGVKVTLVADRGFADKKFFAFLSEELGFYYIIRIKANTSVVNAKGESRKASEWLREDGHILCLKEAKITQALSCIKQFVALKDKGMKAAWYLVSNIPDIKPREIVNCYAKRWKIEPYFRDIKNGRFGYGLRSTHIKARERRDRLFLIVALCYVLLTVLGQAGEQIGFDRFLKVNTIKTRTHSLFRQGLFYYEFFYHFTPEEQHKLLASFNELLAQQNFWSYFFNNLK